MKHFIWLKTGELKSSNVLLSTENVDPFSISIYLEEGSTFPT